MVRYTPLAFIAVYAAVYLIGQFNGFSINSLAHAVLLGILSLPYFFGIFRLTCRAWIGLMILSMLLVTPTLFYLASGRDVFLGSGLLSLVLFGVAFSGYFASQQEHSLGAIIDSINIVFLVNIIYIVIETVLLLFGGFDVLDNYIDEYRYIPGQPIYAMLGVDSPGSPLGIQVGPQYASQILILGIFWFLPIVKLPHSGQAFRWFWFLVCLGFYPFCMTGTSLLMGLVMLVVVMVAFPSPILCRQVAQWRLLLSVVLGIFVVSGGWSLPKYRLKTPDAFDFYMKVFLDPIVGYGNLSLNQKTFGMTSDTSLISYTDFGYGAILWNSGVFLLCVFFVLISWILVQLILRANEKLRFCPSSAIMCLLAVQIFGWLLSLAHYPVAVENVGKIFFALIIGGAIAILYGSKEGWVNQSGKEI